MEQTAVQWLYSQIKKGKLRVEETNCGFVIGYSDDIIEKALQMEKEQIIEAFVNGRLPQFFTNLNEEKYYDKRYKNN